MPRISTKQSLAVWFGMVWFGFFISVYSPTRADSDLTPLLFFYGDIKDSISHKEFASYL